MPSNISMTGNKFSYPDIDEQGQTIRQPSSAFMLLDSRDRYNLKPDGTYTDDIYVPINNFYINHQKLNALGQIKRIAVKEISFPWTVPNVNGYNNTFWVEIPTDPSGNYDPAGTESRFLYTSLVQGFYTQDAIATELALKLNTALLNENGTPSAYNFTWAVQYNVNTSTEKNYRFSIDGFDNNTSLPLEFRVNKPDYFNINKTLIKLMGFNTPSRKNKQLKQFSVGYISGIPSMAYTKYIDICSSTLTKYQNIKDTLTQFSYSDVIYRLYLDNPLNNNFIGLTSPNTQYNFGSYPCTNLYRQIENPKFIEWQPNENISGIDIRLYDDSGELLYDAGERFQNNDFFITFEVSES
jgi:hypothetical protein